MRVDLVAIQRPLPPARWQILRVSTALTRVPHTGKPASWRSAEGATGTAGAYSAGSATKQNSVPSGSARTTIGPAEMSGLLPAAGRPVRSPFSSRRRDRRPERSRCTRALPAFASGTGWKLSFGASRVMGPSSYQPSSRARSGTSKRTLPESRNTRRLAAVNRYFPQ
jgi:hypothetical protein